MNKLLALFICCILFAVMYIPHGTGLPIYKYDPFTRTGRHVTFSDVAHARHAVKKIDVSNVQQYTRNQTLDHFNREDKRTFTQSYFINDQFVNKSNPNTPVFFLLGWEGGLSESDIALGSFVIANFAQSYNGLLLAVEHRFYGSSIPSISGYTYSELLPYLTSEQALADYASYVDFINTKYNTKGPWTVLSGSYGGNLAAWARLKYPASFQFSFSISAPVEAQVEYQGYFDVVGNVVTQANCSAQLTQASQKITQLFDDKSAGWKQIEKDFNTCSPISDIRDAGVLISTYANEFAETVQYAASIDSVAQLCQQVFQTNDPYQDIINSFFSSSQCADVSYNTYLQSFQPVADSLSWQWQTCNEFGYYQTGNAASSPISKYLSLEFYTDVCTYLWNFTESDLNNNIAWTNVNYGGWNISTTNTFFTNGGNDPWHAASVSSDVAGATNFVHVTEGASHCQDMDAPSSSDSPALQKTRALQQAALHNWMAGSVGPSVSTL